MAAVETGLKVLVDQELRENRDKYAAGSAMTGQRGGGRRTGEEERSDRGGMMYLTASVGSLLNEPIPGACSDESGLIKVREMPTCLHTSATFVTASASRAEVLMSHQAELETQSQTLKGLRFYFE